MKIPDSIIAEITRRTDILSLVGEHVQLKQKGGRFWGLCPFHSEKSPSFTVSPENGMFYCFGCHKGGNIFTFLMDLEKLSFVETVKLLAKKSGVDLKYEDNDKNHIKRESLIDLYNRLTTSFHYVLMNDPKAEFVRKYLENRGITGDTIESFQLGYAPAGRDWLLNLLQKKNYTPDFLSTSGLFTIREGRYIPYFYDRLIFPIKNPAGDVIAFGGRTLKEGPPKYLNSPETVIFKKGDNLFGIDRALETIKKNSCFYIVEGYVDVLAMHQAGATNCVAPLGTALTENQSRYLKRYASRGVLVFDGDDAGIRAAIKGVEILENQNIEPFIIEPSDAKDPADILQKYGKERLINLLKCSINGFQYLLNNALIKYDSNTPKGKEEIVRFLFTYLEKIDSKIKREGYFSIISDTLHIDIDSIRDEFNKKTVSYSKINNDVPKANRSIQITDEIRLMLAVTAHRQYFSGFRNEVSVEMLQDENAKKIYIALEECFREETDSHDSFINKIDDQELSNLIIQKISSLEFVQDENYINSSIQKIKKKNLEKKREAVDFLMIKFQKTEPWKLNDLQVQKMILDKQIEDFKKSKN